MDTISDDEESYSDAPWMTNKDPPGLCRSILRQLMKPLPGMASVVESADSPQAGSDENSHIDVVVLELDNDACDTDSGNVTGLLASDVMDIGDADLSESSWIVNIQGEHTASVMTSNLSDSVIESVDAVRVRSPKHGEDFIESGDAQGVGDSCDSAVVLKVDGSATCLTVLGDASDASKTDIEQASDKVTDTSEPMEFSGDQIREYLAIHNITSSQSFDPIIVPPFLESSLLPSDSMNAPPTPPYCYPLDPFVSPPFLNFNPLSPTTNFRLPIALQHILALDLNIESIAPYCAKPKSMYTFICAQPFRRDEYASHFGNVHGDIHSGLNGWLEARCPLALYGCTYSVLRLNPHGGCVRFSSVLDSFGFKPTPSSQCLTSSMVSVDIATPGCAFRNSTQCTSDENRASKLNITLGGSSLSVQGGDDSRKEVHSVEADPEMSHVALNSHELDDQTCNQDTKLSPLETETVKDFSRIISDCEATIMSAERIDAAQDVQLTKEDSQNAVKDKKFANEVSSQERQVTDISQQLDLTRNVPKFKECTPEIYTSKDYDSAVSVETARTQPVFRKPYPEYLVEQTPPRDEDTLSPLPFEILQYVGRCLDSFSLCNLALTSHYLRDVCRSLVERRGIVIQEWEKVPAKTWRRHSWVVTYQVIRWKLGMGDFELLPG